MVMTRSGGSSALVHWFSAFVVLETYLASGDSSIDERPGDACDKFLGLECQVSCAPMLATTVIVLNTPSSVHYSRATSTAARKPQSTQLCSTRLYADCSPRYRSLADTDTLKYPWWSYQRGPLEALQLVLVVHRCPTQPLRPVLRPPPVCSSGSLSRRAGRS